MWCSNQLTSPVHFVYLVCLVCLVYLVHLVCFVQSRNQPNQIDQTNQLNQIDQMTDQCVAACVSTLWDSTIRTTSSRGTSSYRENSIAYVPRPAVNEFSAVAYVSSSAIGTRAVINSVRSFASTWRIRPRRAFKSPITP